jgi:ferric-dicitrate binding protein FerR (iron transport regulator)
VIRLNDPATSVVDFLAWQIWLAESPDHSRIFGEVQGSWRRAGSISRAVGLNLKEFLDSHPIDLAPPTNQ